MTHVWRARQPHCAGLCMNALLVRRSCMNSSARLNLVSHGAFGETEKADSKDQKAKPGEAAASATDMPT